MSKAKKGTFQIKTVKFSLFNFLHITNIMELSITNQQIFMKFTLPKSKNQGLKMNKSKKVNRKDLTKKSDLSRSLVLVTMSVRNPYSTDNAHNSFLVFYFYTTLWFHYRRPYFQAEIESRKPYNLLHQWCPKTVIIKRKELCNKHF